MDKGQMSKWKVVAAALVMMVTILAGFCYGAAGDKHTKQEKSNVSTASSTVQAARKSSTIQAEEEPITVQTVDGKVVLTERQKAILEKEGLPTDYYELEGQQQDAITRIELCLDYLDRTYPDDTFTYLSYEGFGFMSGRSPSVYALSEKIGEDRCVSVGVKKFDGQYKFYDDYKMVMDSNVYQAEIEKYIRSQLPDTEFFVDAEIHKYVEGDSYIMERAAGACNIIMNDTFENENQVKDFLNSIAEWMNGYNKDMAKSILCIVFYPNDYKEANLYNYNDLSKKRKEKYRARCSINSSGDVSVHTY